MPGTRPKPIASIYLTALLLLATSRFCLTQSTVSPQGAPAAATDTSASLPDAPEPHNNPIPAATLPPNPEPITLAGTPKRILFDQKAIWTSPLHLRPLDATWLLPLGAATGTLIGSDQHTMTALVHINANDQKHFNTLSDAGVAALAALPAGMYLWSLGRDAPQAHETGLLTGDRKSVV